MRLAVTTLHLLCPLWCGCPATVGHGECATVTPLLRVAEWDQLAPDEQRVARALLDDEPRLKDFPDLTVSFNCSQSSALRSLISSLGQVNFIRGYSHMDHWQENAIDYARKAFDWREGIRADDITNPEHEDELVGGAEGAAMPATKTATKSSWLISCVSY